MQAKLRFSFLSPSKAIIKTRHEAKLHGGFLCAWIRSIKKVQRTSDQEKAASSGLAASGFSD
ncbi:hypothetical protein AQ1_00677 [alpha proteobacterium Q-1]|nr:hypothetical protein AQ1_00677 [alpha proteobacterium Q-1]